MIRSNSKRVSRIQKTESDKCSATTSRDFLQDASTMLTKSGGPCFRLRFRRVRKRWFPADASPRN
jgi:hypothetical protein